MRPATRPSVRAGTASRTLPPAVTAPLPELVALLVAPELLLVAEAEEDVAPVAADVSSVLEGRGCSVIGGLGVIGT